MAILNGSCRELDMIMPPVSPDLATEYGSARYLELQDKDKLVAMVAAREANENQNLRDRLLLEIARINPAGVDLLGYRSFIARVNRTNGFVDYHSAYEYATRDYSRRILTLQRVPPGLTKRYEPVFTRLAVVKVSLWLATYQHVRPHLSCLFCC